MLDVSQKIFDGADMNKSKTMNNNYIKITGMAIILSFINSANATTTIARSFDQARWPFNTVYQISKNFRNQQTVIESFLKAYNKSQYEDIFKKLENAIGSENYPAVNEIFLANRINPNSELTSEQNKYEMNDLLHYSIEKGNILLVASLLSAKYCDTNGTEKFIFDINSKIDGFTPVMLASYLEYSNIVNLLINEGADLFKTTENGTTLHYAIKRNDENLMQIIFDSLKSSFNYSYNLESLLNKKDLKGRNIFLLACEYFEKKKISPLVFARILSEHNSLIIDKQNDSEGATNLLNISIKLHNLLKNDSNWWKFGKNFKMDDSSRNQLIEKLDQLIEKLK